MDLANKTSPIWSAQTRQISREQKRTAPDSCRPPQLWPDGSFYWFFLLWLKLRSSCGLVLMSISLEKHIWNRQFDRQGQITRLYLNMASSELFSTDQYTSWSTTIREDLSEVIVNCEAMQQRQRHVSTSHEHVWSSCAILRCYRAFSYSQTPMLYFCLSECAPAFQS